MDAFEILGVPRRLVLTDDDLREAFRAAGKTAHPDAGGDDDRFAGVQRAYAILASPAARLRHWLELEGVGFAERGAVPAVVMDLFGRLGPLIQQAEALARKRSAARSALARALFEPEVHAIREQIETAIAEVDAAIATQTAAFPAIEAGTCADPGATVRALAFLEKWRAELRAKFADCS